MRTLSSTILAFAFATAIPAGAQTIPLNTLTLNGNAVLGSNGAIRLTDNTSQVSSAFIPTPYTLSPTSSFEVAFIYSAYIQGQPADGLAFVAQNTTMGANYLGLDGGGLGFFTLTTIPAIAATFDYYSNSGTGTLPGAVSIALPIGQDLATVYPTLSLIDNAKRYVWVEYNNPQKTMIVYYSATATKPTTPIVGAVLSQDLSSEFGGQVYFGITGATGALTSGQYLFALAVKVTD